jgi:hypothetical protein
MQLDELDLTSYITNTKLFAYHRTDRRIVPVCAVQMAQTATRFFFLGRFLASTGTLPRFSYNISKR